jgi:hypothetical protein
MHLTTSLVYSRQPFLPVSSTAAIRGNFAAPSDHPSKPKRAGLLHLEPTHFSPPLSMHSIRIWSIRLFLHSQLVLHLQMSAFPSAVHAGSLAATRRHSILARMQPLMITAPSTGQQSADMVEVEDLVLYVQTSTHPWTISSVAIHQDHVRRSLHGSRTSSSRCRT